MSDAKSETTLDVEVGLLLRRQFRNELERLKFKGYPVEWHEGKGMLESTFSIKAPTHILRSIQSWADEWEAANGKR